MCNSSFVAACVALALAATTLAQEYSVDEPSGDVQFSGVQGSENSLNFNSTEAVINPGERLELTCGFSGTIRQCVWELEGGATIQVADVTDGLVSGISRPAVTEGNECGIIIDSVTTEQHGLWTCEVYIPGNKLQQSKNVIVTVKPTSPFLELDSSVLEVTSGIETDVRCVVGAARPAVNIRWFLGDKDVTLMAETEETPTDSAGMYKSTSTLRRSFEPMENGQVLMCSVSHQTLATTANATVPINVVFKPVEKPVSTFYQIRPGTDYEVRMNFSANPEPTKKEWSYGDTFQTIAVSIPIPGSSDRYTTDIESLGNGMYTAILRITGFTEGDANQKYILLVANEYGETEYKVKLSMDEAPKDGDRESRVHDKNPSTEYSMSEETLSGGAVAGIIIVVLIIVAAVGAAGYARYRQMFCFAPRAESKAYIGDEETGNGTANEAIKASTDHVNGKTDTTVANGNGNVEQTQVDEINTEKKNTDV